VSIPERRFKSALRDFSSGEGMIGDDGRGFCRHEQ